MKVTLTWFEIPVKNLARAKKFYSTLFKIKMAEMKFGRSHIALFPGMTVKNGGSLVKGPAYTPSRNGILVYLDGGKDITGVLSRVPKAGGKIVDKKYSVGKYGFIATFLDTEGNKIALHSMK